jgi:hypothetical protein
MTKSANVLDFNQPDTAKGVGGELAADTTALVAVIGTVHVTDRASLEQAVVDRQAIGDSVKRVQAFFEPFKSSAHKLHKMLCDRENEILGPLLRLDQAMKDGISSFKAAEDRARQQREREESDRRRREDEERAAREAAALEAAGDHALAAAVVDEAIAAPAPVVVLPDSTKGIEGLKFTRRWLWRISNEALVPREFLCLDEKKIGAYARAMKGSGAIPGIEIYTVDDPVR